MDAVHAHLPKPHDPFIDLVPPQGIKLTPTHYAYLKISEGCNHRCTFCIIPSMRGDLVSRPIGDVMQEAENLVKAGVKELLVISQDTSAYGVDVKYRTGFWSGRPLKTRMTELAQALGEARRLGAAALRLSVSARRRGDPADGRGQDPALPRRAVPAREPAHPQAHEAPGQRREQARAHRAGARSARRSRSAAPSSPAFPARPRREFEELLDFLEEAQLDRVGCFAYSPGRGRDGERRCPTRCPRKCARSAARASWHAQAKISAARLKRKVGRTLRVLVDEIDGNGAIARSAADAPEIDGVVRVAGGASCAPASSRR